MQIGLVVEGDLEQTSGGYRYDRKLVSFLETQGDEVDVISLPARSDDNRGLETVSAPSNPSNTDRSIRDRLDRPYDVLLQDELCHPTLAEHNPRLEQPGAIVSLVHLLRTPDPAVDDSRVREREKRYLESVDAAVCTSSYTRDRTTDLAEGDLPTLVAPPAGRHEGAALSADAVRERARTDSLRIAFVGNVVPRKNVTTLLEALARIDGRKHDWRATVVGSLETDPAYARAVRKRARSFGLDDRVTFTGSVETTVLESILERSHVLAVPARYEGFGMVYLEAMEYGVVPIASSVGGASEFVADGRNGFVVDPTDPDRLADRLGALAAERDRLAALGTGALETATAHPTWAKTLESVRTFLRQCCERGTTGGDPT
ncbi:glycosyltransferase family 4 protein [Natronorubrum sp. DTA28]|uniref:glycosyltransferase family 4 protein n=1 Tax=Natronorubrum sp. DTA28 TaxID=3447019 RepID=UPI003F8680B8